MDMRKLFFTFIVVILYLPMVFFGANMLFPDYEDRYNYYRGSECYNKYPVPVAEPLTAEQQTERNQNLEECQRKDEEQRKAWDKEKRTYDGWRYIFIVVVSLVALLAAIFVPMDESILLGLFLGSTIAAFFATWIFFDSRSKIGFGVLVAIFIASITFIQKYKGSKSHSKKRK